jgi:hypothetical protein
MKLVEQDGIGTVRGKRREGERDPGGGGEAVVVEDSVGTFRPGSKLSE